MGSCYALLKRKHLLSNLKDKSSTIFLLDSKMSWVRSAMNTFLGFGMDVVNSDSVMSWAISQLAAVVFWIGILGRPL